MPALPEMVFPDSWLRLDHEKGCGLAFYALDALKRVDTNHDPLKVAAAEEWGRTRSAETLTPIVIECAIFQRRELGEGERVCSAI